MTADVIEHPRAASAARQAPANLAAEQALLGALLYDNGAYDRCDSVRPEHFFEPFHARLFAVIENAVRKGQLADPILVADKFARDPAFEEMGGLRYLADLVDRAPPAASAPDFARVVTETAKRRELIRIAGDVSQRAETPDLDDTAADLIEHAEAELYALAETGQARGGVVAFSDAVTEAVEMAAAAYQRDGSLSGLSTGLIDLDRKLGGLHPSDLVILAARPSAGKTALACNIAFHAARNYAYETHPDGTRKTTAGGQVLFFSLEMSAAQLATRILADVSGVSGDRLRKGEIEAHEFGRIRDAALEISEAPLHIDDTGGLPIAKLAARARRQKRRTGLDLIVVDYLQLVTTGRRAENRVQEVSEITQGLKALAKELEVPVLALSQLSRQVEQREDKRPQLSDLRECVIGSTLLIDADTGRQVPISALKVGQRVLGVAPSLKVGAGPVADVWSTGVKPVFKVTARSGRTITATANHPFLTSRGWVRLEDLTPDDRLAIPYRAPGPAKPEAGRGDLCRLLGYLAGNGSYQEHRTMGLIIPDDEGFSDACGIIAARWPEVSIKVRANGYNDAWISRTYENGHGRPFGNPMREWLRGIGLLGARDTDKHVPDFVFEAGIEGAGEFLAGYLETDGCVTNTGDRWSIRFDTTSHRLAQDVAALLTRIGVACVIGAPTMGGVARNPIYRISIAQSPENMRLFAERVPARGVRGRRLSAMVQAMSDRATRNSLFVLPSELATYTSAIASFRDQGKALSRQKAAEILAANDDETLRAWVESDFIWDEIRSIEPAGEEETFDVRVPGLNSFIGNGIAVHNSGAIEQDADMVLFLYREEYYRERAQPEPDTDAYLKWCEQMDACRGKADVIVGKQRHGPIGTVTLAFNGELTKFSNLARDDRYPAARNPYGGE